MDIEKVARRWSWWKMSSVSREPGTRLADRILLANGFVLIVAAAVLAATPFGVSCPAKGKELLALACGVLPMIVLDGILVRRALVPLRELRESMRRIDPLQPGERLALRHVRRPAT